jgi:DNA-binding SARP family transcriptional activator
MGEPLIELRLLGAVEVTVHGTVADVGGRQQRRLLAVLGLWAGRLVPVDELVAVLFDSDERPNADASLRSYLSRLRRSLRRAGAPDTLIRTEPSGYRLDLAVARLDVDRFTEAGAAARSASAAGRWNEAIDCAERALAAWRGRPFTPFSDERWASSEVSRLEDTRLEAIETRTAAQLELGDASVPVAELESLVAEHPRRERMVGQLALALHRLGRRSSKAPAARSGSRPMAPG